MKDPGSSSFLIGIGGASSSGKSTLAHSLVERFTRLQVPGQEVHVALVAQDDFYKQHQAQQIPVVDGVEVWDCPEALRMGEFIHVVRQWKKQPGLQCQRCRRVKEQSLNGCEASVSVLHLVVVEGFLLYWHEDIYRHFDISLTIDLPFEVSKQRRESRQDREIKDPAGYFERFAWPNFFAYNHLGLPEIQKLDGRLSKEELLRVAEEAISTRLRLSPKSP